MTDGWRRGGQYRTRGGRTAYRSGTAISRRQRRKLQAVASVVVIAGCVAMAGPLGAVGVPALIGHPLLFGLAGLGVAAIWAGPSIYWRARSSAGRTVRHHSRQARRKATRAATRWAAKRRAVRTGQTTTAHGRR